MASKMIESRLSFLEEEDYDGDDLVKSAIKTKKTLRQTRPSPCCWETKYDEILFIYRL